MRNRTILITGATGFVGSHLVERLAAEGATLRCLVRAAGSRRTRYLPPEGTKIMLGDLVTGTGLDRAVDGAEIVIHLAGVTKAVRAADYYAGNALATRNLVAACERQGAHAPRFLHISSLAAAGPGAQDRPVRPEDQPHPVSHYGRSKLAGEEAVRRSRFAARATILRPPVVYGPRDTDVYQVLKGISRGWMLRMRGGESYFSFIHVVDLVEGILHAAACDAGRGRTYFLANPEPVSWTEFARVAACVMTRSVRIVSVPWQLAWLGGFGADLVSRFSRRAGIFSREKVGEARQRFWTCDAAAAGEELGFRPQFSLREGMALTLEWYREAGWLSY